MRGHEIERIAKNNYTRSKRKTNNQHRKHNNNNNKSVVRIPNEKMVK